MTKTLKRFILMVIRLALIAAVIDTIIGSAGPLVLQDRATLILWAWRAFALVIALLLGWRLHYRWDRGDFLVDE